MQRLAAMLFALALVMAVLAGAPGPALAAPEVHLDASCTPDSIRPNSEAVFNCMMHVTNGGDATATGLEITGTLDLRNTIPSFELFDSTVDGVPIAVGTGQITFQVPDLGPGDASDSVGRVIFGARDAGAYGFRLELRMAGVVVDARDVSFEATPSSPNPPSRLLVGNTLVAVGPPAPLSPPNGFPRQGEKADYEIVIKNVSDETIDGLTVWDRQDARALLGANVPPATSIDDTTHIAHWELGSLAPGEQRRIAITIERAGEACASSLNTVVVGAYTALRAGELYLARADRAITLGTDCPLGQGGDGGGGRGGDGSLALPGTGSGASPDGSLLWPAIAVALAGAAALAIGLRRATRP